MEYPNLPPIVWKTPIFVVGLTGALGSGKSTVTALFKELDVWVASADILAREILYSEQIRPNLLELFGQEILDTDGVVSRHNLAHLVFTQPDELKKLNALIHPKVQKQFQKIRSSLKAGEIFIYDVPLLFEAKLQDQFDLTITVSAADTIRLERVKKRNNWSEQQFWDRDRSQLSLTEKEKMADLVIRNEGDAQALKAVIQNIYNHICKGHQQA